MPRIENGVTLTGSRITEYDPPPSLDISRYLTGCKDAKKPPPDLKIPLSGPVPPHWSDHQRYAHVPTKPQGVPLIQTLETSPDFSPSLESSKPGNLVQ